MSTNRRVVLFSALLIAGAMPASGGVIILDDKSDFVGDYTVIDFETWGDGTPIDLETKGTVRDARGLTSRM